MKRLRPLVFFGLALVLGVITSVLVFSWLQNEKNRLLAAPLPMSQNVQVVVANADIPWGSKLTPEMVPMQEVTPGAIPEGHFKTLDEIKDDELMVVLPVAFPKMTPEAACGFQALMKCSLASKRWRGAVQAGVALLPVAPDKFTVAQIVRALVEMGEYDKAFQAAQELLKKFPQFEESLASLAHNASSPPGSEKGPPPTPADSPKCT